AHDLIRLSGLVPGKDIDIVYTGVRPGEKLFEELVNDGETVRKTSHEKIMALDGGRIDVASVQETVRRLEELLENDARDAHTLELMVDLLYKAVDGRPVGTPALSPAVAAASAEARPAVAEAPADAPAVTPVPTPAPHV